MSIEAEMSWKGWFLILSLSFPYYFMPWNNTWLVLAYSTMVLINIMHIIRDYRWLG
jgi:hypothetical protein